MRRVVVTGLGIISPIGNSAEEVAAALKAGTSGIEFSPQMAERGFRSQIAGTLKIDPAEHIDKRKMRFMGPGAAYAYLAMEQAIADAGLTEDEVSNERTGVIAGSGGPSTQKSSTQRSSPLQKSPSEQSKRSRQSPQKSSPGTGSKQASPPQGGVPDGGVPERPGHGRQHRGGLNVGRGAGPGAGPGCGGSAGRPWRCRRPCRAGRARRA